MESRGCAFCCGCPTRCTAGAAWCSLSMAWPSISSATIRSHASWPGLAMWCSATTMWATARAWARPTSWGICLCATARKFFWKMCCACAGQRLPSCMKTARCPCSCSGIPWAVLWLAPACRAIPKASPVPSCAARGISRARFRWRGAPFRALSARFAGRSTVPKPWIPW